MKTKAEEGPGRLKTAVLNWLGFRWTDIEQWRAIYGQESHSGEKVSQETATRHSAVYACTRLIAQRISTLPCNLYETLNDGSRQLARRHPLFRILRMKPNARMTAVVFWEAVVASILLQRGAFLEKRKNGAGQVAALGFLHPLRTSLDESRDEYRYVDKEGKNRWIPRDRVIHIPAFTTDGECGVSVIEYGLQTIGNALAADKAAGKVFKQGLLPTTAFSYPAKLKDNQRDEMRKTVKTLSGAAQSGNPIVMESGMTAEQIGISPHDAQLLESRQASAEEVCSLFGVPPTMIGRGDKASSWASSSEQLNLWFLHYTLVPWMRRIEMAITDGLLSPQDQLKYYVEFNPEAMLRGDSTAQREFLASALQNGYMNRDYAAKVMNLPRVPGGDIYTVQSNLIPLEQLGESDSATGLRSALAAFMQQGNPDET